MGKKIKLSDMTEHLFEMAERLLDDEVCSDSGSIENEVKKASALVDIANTVVGIQQAEINKTETEIKMCKVAESLGKTYVPEKIVMQESESKKKLLLGEIN